MFLGNDQQFVKARKMQGKMEKTRSHVESRIRDITNILAPPVHRLVFLQSLEYMIASILYHPLFIGQYSRGVQNTLYHQYSSNPCSQVSIHVESRIHHIINILATPVHRLVFTQSLEFIKLPKVYLSLYIISQYPFRVQTLLLQYFIQLIQEHD